MLQGSIHYLQTIGHANPVILNQEVPYRYAVSLDDPAYHERTREGLACVVSCKHRRTVSLKSMCL